MHSCPPWQHPSGLAQTPLPQQVSSGSLAGAACVPHASLTEGLSPPDGLGAPQPEHRGLARAERGTPLTLGVPLCSGCGAGLLVTGGYLATVKVFPQSLILPK